MFKLNKKRCALFGCLMLTANASQSFASIHDPVTGASWVSLYDTTFPALHDLEYYQSNGYSIATASQVFTLFKDFGMEVSFVQGVYTGTYNQSTVTSADSVNAFMQELTHGDYNYHGQGLTSTQAWYVPPLGADPNYSWYGPVAIGVDWEYSATGNSILHVYDLSSIPGGIFYPEAGYWLTSVPLPPAFLMMASGLVGLAWTRKNVGPDNI